VTVLVALILQVAAATPPRPTPVTVRPGEPRTLSDVARERKDTPKGAGTFSVAGGSAAPPASAAATDGAAAADLYVERADAPGVGRTGKVPVEGVVVNRGDAAACGVRVVMRVFYEDGGLAAERETTIQRVDAHGKASFRCSVQAPSDLGMSRKQANGTSVSTVKPMKTMGRVEAAIGSVGSCGASRKKRGGR
jgi:hypothetical protein